MTDRELLELAAKAAGVRYDAKVSAIHDEIKSFWGLWLVFDDEPAEGARRYWNPLTDDGDALRLAIHFGLTITPNYHVEQQSSGVIAFTTLEDGQDPCAATRRAIVRAAAAIGAHHD